MQARPRADRGLERGEVDLVALAARARAEPRPGSRARARRSPRRSATPARGSPPRRPGRAPSGSRDGAPGRPEAVTTISRSGSSSTPCSRRYCAGDRLAQRRQAGILGVEGVAVGERAGGRVDDEARRRQVRLAEVQPQHAVHRHRELAELADLRVRDSRERGGVHGRSSLSSTAFMTRERSSLPDAAGPRR